MKAIIYNFTILDNYYLIALLIKSTLVIKYRKINKKYNL